MPEEKELAPITQVAYEAFDLCCKSSDQHFLNRVISSRAHNIFISYPDVRDTLSGVWGPAGAKMLEHRKSASGKVLESLFVSEKEWVYRIYSHEGNSPVCLDFVGRDSLLMKRIFATPRFAIQRLSCP